MLATEKKDKRKPGSKALIGDKRAVKLTNMELAKIVKKLEARVDLLEKLLVYFKGDGNIAVAKRVIEGEKFI